MAVAPSGQIVVVGEATNTSNESVGFGVARLNSDGSIDTTFGGSGVVTTAFGGGGQPTSVVVQPDNKIIAFGTTAAASGGQQNLTLARYLAQ